MPESHLDFSVLSCVPWEPRRKSVQLSLTFTANCSQASPVSSSPTIPRTHLRSHQTLLSFIHPLTHSASMLLHPRSEPRNMLKTRQPVWIKHSALFVSTLLSPCGLSAPTRSGGRYILILHGWSTPQTGNFSTLLLVSALSTDTRPSTEQDPGVLAD